MSGKQAPQVRPPVVSVSKPVEGAVSSATAAVPGETGSSGSAEDDAIARAVGNVDSSIVETVQPVVEEIENLVPDVVPAPSGWVKVQALKSVDRIVIGQETYSFVAYEVATVRRDHLTLLREKRLIPKA